MKYKLAIFVFLWVLAFGSVAGEQRSIHLTGIYSNLVQSKESGDLSGMELMIIPSNEGAESTYSAFVQVADGGAPFTAIVSMSVTDSKVWFDFPAVSPYPNEHVVGTFVGKDIVLRWGRGSEEHLKRGKSFWQ
jgi:hypothetical protein